MYFRNISAYALRGNLQAQSYSTSDVSYGNGSFLLRCKYA